MTDAAWAPLSYGQEALWFLQQTSPQSRAYNTGTLLQIHGAIDGALWRRLFQTLAQRHPLLRTTFALHDGQPVQIIRATAAPFEQIDCSGQSWDTVMQTVEQVLWQPYDLEQGPLFRATLVSHTAESHVLLVSSHHIICDGTSYWILLDELLRLYALARGADTEPLPPIQSSYAAFVDRERQILEDNADLLREYWIRALSGELPVLDLTLDRPRPPQQTGRTKALPFTIDSGLRDQLRALAHHEGVSFYTVQLAALHVLLHRYSGQTDILVGVPASVREPAFAGVFGDFVNLIAVRSSATNMPFTDFLRHVRVRLQDAIKHRSYPFSLAAQQAQRDSSRSRLCQASFVSQQSHLLGANSRCLLNGEQLAVADLSCRLLKWWPGGGEVDLVFDLMERTNGMVGYIRYNPQIFDEASIARMGQHYQRLLAGIVADPAARIDELPLLGDAERQQMLVGWNASAADIPADRCLHELIAEQAALTPAATAVVWGDQRLSYGDLDRRANQLARHLQSLGVGPDQRVGLYMERSIELLVGLLGILKAGGAYVPLDPSYPAERLAFMLADAQVSVLLTARIEDRGSRIDENQETRDKRQETRDKRQLTTDNGQRTTDAEAVPVHPPSSILYPLSATVDLIADWPMIAEAAATPPPCCVTPGNLAYVIYTSGSTGQPKGVMVEHRALASFSEMARQLYGITPDDRVLQFASICFDTSVEEIFPCLSAGATLVLRTESMLDSAAIFLRRCREWALTILDLPTAYWHELAAQMPESAEPLPASVRLVIIGGEQLLAERLAIWQAHVDPRVQLMNTYGPTEATVIATSCALIPGTPGHTIAIGKPIRTAQVYLLDHALQPVPIGVAGELYIGGAGLARGYLGRPELTAERFVPNPFADHRPPTTDHRRSRNSKLKTQNSKLYKTGDLARYRADGTIEFVGRADQQIKIRGFRIELGEIESLLRQHSAVQECIVAAQPDQRGERRLVAYVVPVAEDRGSRIEDRRPTTDKRTETTDNGQRTTDNGQLTSDLRAFLQTQLPEHMLPAAFVALDGLPITPNGKVDRQALPPHDWSSLAAGAAYLAPRTATEARLAEIWCAVLGLARVGVEDRFFDVGGHSLLATQITNQIGKVFQVDVSLRSLFEAPTIAGLAAQIDQLLVIQLLQQPLADADELREELAL